jgi:RNA polymerase sigma factor (sigma-70 family)
MTREPLSQFVRQLRQTLDADALATVPDPDLLAAFRRGRDPAAFETLIHRHGPKVLAACRKVLTDPADIEDAFQATFVVLMRDPAAVRDGRRLGGWLYGVAHRVSLKALTRRRRREEIEARAGEKREPTSDLSWREACAVLHEELDKLPDAYRLPLMLCYLDGLSRDEAARRLGRNLNSIKKALETGRERLRRRLGVRGIALSAGLLAAVAEPAGAASVTPRSVQSAVSAAAGGSILPRVAVLARSRGAGPLRAGLGACLAASVVIACVALGQAPKPGERPQPEVPRQPAADKGPTAKAGDALAEKFTYQGRVVNPDGKPVKDAQIFLDVVGATPKPLAPRAKTGADGRFSFELKRSDFDARSFARSPTPWVNGHVLATAPGFGVAWTQGTAPGRDMELKLNTDDAPIEGRVLNLQGQPVPGARVRVLWVFRPRSGELTQWHEGLKGVKEAFRVMQGLEGVMDPNLRRYGLDALIPPTKSGDDGRFSLKGIGKERVALVRVEGDGIETRDVFYMTGPGDPISFDAFVHEGIMFSPGKNPKPQDTVLGARSDVLVGPSRTVAGVITDVDSGKPVAGAAVMCERFASGVIDRHRAWAMTDAKGRYALTGLPVEKETTLRVEPSEAEPYVAITAPLPDQAGLEPIPLDLKLKRGVWLTGRVLDRETKQPVSASVRYAANLENPHLKEVPGFTVEFDRRTRPDDGSFRMPILPGRGWLAIQAGSPDHPRYGIAGDVPAGLPEFITAKPFTIVPKSLHALVELDAAADAKEVRQEVLLTPGRGVTVVVVGPDGEKLTGVVATDDTHARRSEKLGDDATLTVRGVSARQGKVVQAVCPEKKLAGSVKVTGDEKGPVKLKLEQWKTIKGRVVDEDGKPVTGAELSFIHLGLSPDDTSVHGFWFKGGAIQTGNDGTFQLDGLVPGSRYALSVKVKGRTPQVLALRADWKGSEPKDFGDIKPAP